MIRGRECSPAARKARHLTDFTSLGLTPAILKSISELGYTEPTPIQTQAIPLLLEGRDLMGLAQTGTGKTAAFGLPLIQKLSAYGARPGPRATHALILAPTRELVNQIATNLRGFVRHSHLKVTSVVGGQSINAQTNALQRGTDILVATPGRLLDLVERKAVRLDTAKVLVLDEADQMLDLGFIHALRRIAKLVGTPRQTMLFSATMPKLIEDLSRAYLTDPVRVEVPRPAARPTVSPSRCISSTSAPRPICWPRCCRSAPTICRSSSPAPSMARKSS
jgi:ATP-dependent RNA helicase RhlE